MAASSRIKDSFGFASCNLFQTCVSCRCSCLSESDSRGRSTGFHCYHNRAEIYSIELCLPCKERPSNWNRCWAKSRIHCMRLAGDKATLWRLRHHPRVLNIQLRKGVKQAEISNCIENYVGNKYGEERYGLQWCANNRIRLEIQMKPTDRRAGTQQQQQQKMTTTLRRDCIGFGNDCWSCIGGPCDWFGSLTGGPPACLPNGTRPFGEYSFGVILPDRDCGLWVTTTTTTEAPSFGGSVWPVVFGFLGGIFLLMILLFAACVWAWKRSPHRAAAYAQIRGTGADGRVDAINDLLNDIVELDNFAQPAVPAAPAAVEEDDLEEVLVDDVPAGVAVADVTPR